MAAPWGRGILEFEGEKEIFHCTLLHYLIFFFFYYDHAVFIHLKQPKDLLWRGEGAQPQPRSSAVPVPSA